VLALNALGAGVVGQSEGAVLLGQAAGAQEGVFPAVASDPGIRCNGLDGDVRAAVWWWNAVAARHVESSRWLLASELHTDEEVVQHACADADRAPSNAVSFKRTNKVGASTGKIWSRNAEGQWSTTLSSLQLEALGSFW